MNDDLFFLRKHDFHNDIIIDQLLRQKLLTTHDRQFLRASDVFLLEHCFVLAIKLLVMNAIKSLLGRFTFPCAWQELGDDVIHSFFSHLLLLLQLVSKHSVFSSQLHVWLLVKSLSKSCSDIRIVGVRVLPELSSKALA